MYSVGYIQLFINFLSQDNTIINKFAYETIYNIMLCEKSITLFSLGKFLEKCSRKGAVYGVFIVLIYLAVWMSVLKH